MEMEKVTNNLLAYCVKCRAKKEMKDAQKVSFQGKGGKERFMLKSVCPVCGTKMCRILPNTEKVEPKEATEKVEVSQDKTETPHPTEEQTKEPTIEQEIKDFDDLDVN